MYGKIKANLFASMAVAEIFGGLLELAGHPHY
jgi:hypothetical protein